jgi:hypothetical protein
VLSCLLCESPGPAVRRAWEAVEFVVTTDFTLVECDRLLHRARNLGQLSTDGFAEHSSEVRRIADGRILLCLSDEIVERARGTLPGPLASLSNTEALIPETVILTLGAREGCSRAEGLTPATLAGWIPEKQEARTGI